MNMLILGTATRYLMPLLLLLSIFVLLRGHNAPGGGFIGGLIAAAAFALYSIAYGVQLAKRILTVEPRRLMSIGLALAAISGAIPMFFGEPFMKGMWVELPILGKLGTPTIFDIGVYLVVVGVMLTIIFTLLDEIDDRIKQIRHMDEVIE